MAENYPSWGYTLENGEVVGKIFADGKLPKGWVDSPAKVKQPKKADK